MKIQAVTFDLWQTLIADTLELRDKRDNLRNIKMREVLYSAGFDFNVEKISSANSNVLARLTETWLKNRDENIPFHLTTFLNELKISSFHKLDKSFIKDLENAYVSILMDVPPVLVKNAKSVLIDLRNSGFKLGLICNTGRIPGSTLRVLLSEFNILEYFTFLCFSNEQGIRKPCREIFEYVLEKLGSEPSKAVHVGDNPGTDIQGAKNTGIKGVLFTGALFNQDSIKQEDYSCTDLIIDDLNQLPGLLKILDKRD
jgi:FMN phosphatase YigB (HAD superfamily)